MSALRQAQGDKGDVMVGEWKEYKLGDVAIFKNGK